ncbi:MAG: hypothetical protein LBT37_07965 [Lactobacillaceae bacterium]|nr:hypothetical protein [Lactobacillaceae bacterium]
MLLVFRQIKYLVNYFVSLFGGMLVGFGLMAITKICLNNDISKNIELIIGIFGGMSILMIGFLVYVNIMLYRKGVS